MAADERLLRRGKNYNSTDAFKRSPSAQPVLLGGEDDDPYLSDDEDQVKFFPTTQFFLYVWLKRDATERSAASENDRLPSRAN